MFALSLIIYEIFTKQTRCQKFDIENAGQDQVGENVTCANRLEMFDYIQMIFFQHFSRFGTYIRKLEHTFPQTKTNTHIHRNERGVWLKEKLAMDCKFAYKSA